MAKAAAHSARPRRAAAPVAGAEEDMEDKLTRHWRATFIGALAETSNVTAAAAAAGINPSRAYKVRRAEPEFARQWLDALCEGYEHLEMEVLHRLRFGEPRDGADRKFDVGGALRLLAMHQDTVQRERAMRDHGDAEAVRASLEAKVASLRAKALERFGEGAGTGNVG